MTKTVCVILVFLLSLNLQAFPSKAYSGLSVNIELLRSEKINDNETVYELKGTVSSKQTLNNVNMKWAFSDPNQNSETTVPLLEPNRSKEVIIRVTGPTEDNLQVHLQVSAMRGRTRIGTVKQFNTKDSKKVKSDGLNQLDRNGSTNSDSKPKKEPKIWQ